MTSISWWSWWRTRCCGRASTRQEFTKARTLAVQSIAAAKDADPRELIGIYGDAWLFRGHPYGRPTEGSEKSLESISLDDLKSYYAAQCGGDRLIVTVVGDIRATEMKRRLEAAFGGWQKSTVAAPAATAMARVQGRRVLLVDKPGATQTYFWLGNVGADRTDPGPRGAVRGQHDIRRPVYLDAQHRASDQERAELWRKLRRSRG